VLRAGYSALAPNSWIRPHVGASNKKLKLHLGLVVPAIRQCTSGTEDACSVEQVPLDVRLARLPKTFWWSDGPEESPDGSGTLTAVDEDACRDSCAFFRIGGGARRTRCWRAGETLLLDDSFEHEVFNTCEQERVVLQLVVEHPALTARRAREDPASAPQTLPVVTNS
jgi:hypothetical protein